MSKLKIIDLFCGAGGLSLGFSLAGYEVVGAMDYFEDACTTFRRNHEELDPLKIICGDITQILPQSTAKLWGKKVDLIIGGPPCQGMSLAGKRLSDDPRNFLFLSFIEYVNFFKPKFFLMENVPGLLSANNGKIKEAILNAFRGIGYNNFDEVRPVILTAANYGVPQLRDRLFFLGSRKRIKFEFFPEPTHTPLNEIGQATFDFITTKKPKYITVKEAISDLPKLKSGMGSDEMSYSTKVNDNRLTDYQKLMRKNSKFVFNHESPNHTDKLLKLIKMAHDLKRFGCPVDPKYSDSKMWDPNKPSFTVKALGQGGGSTNRRAFHYRDIRGSTVRENARIQSFPDNYKFYGSKTNQMTQVGNAVPPLMAKAIANNINEVFLKY